MRKVLFKQKTLPIEVYFIFDWTILKIFVYFAQKILMMGGKQKRAEACFNYKQEAANKLLSLYMAICLCICFCGSYWLSLLFCEKVLLEPHSPSPEAESQTNCSKHLIPSQCLVSFCYAAIQINCQVRFRC